MKRLFAIIDLLAFYLLEVVTSNLAVARDVLGSQKRIQPGIVNIKVGDLTDFQAFILANMVTMTPGTLSLDIIPEKHSLTLHTLYAQNPEELQAQISNSYERRIRNAF
tara:strand:- start:399 stop:722 length:324 start_codon:yes stop_codon:yes gene_type:complete